MSRDPLADATWRKSSRSKDNECVEVAVTADAIGVRDSKDPAGPVLRLSREVFGGLVADIKAGKFD